MEKSEKMFTLYKLSPIVDDGGSEKHAEKEADGGDLVISELPKDMQPLARHIWAKIGPHVRLDDEQCIQYISPPLKGSPLLLLFKSVLDNSTDTVPFDRRRFIRLVLDYGASEALPRSVVRQFISSKK